MNYIYHPQSRGHKIIGKTGQFNKYKFRSPGKLRLSWRFPRYEIPWRSMALIVAGAIILSGIGTGGYYVHGYMTKRSNEKLAWQKQKDEQEAKAKIEALKNQIKNEQDAIKLGRQKQDEGELREAEIAFTLALQYQPNWRDAFLCLGQTQLAMRKYSEAEASLKRALSLDPVYPITHNLLATLYQKIGKKDLATAESAKAAALAKQQGLEIGG